MKWFRSGLPPHQTALAMLGAKPGQAVIFLGATVAELAAEVAKVTGLNGRTLVADEGDAARAVVERAAGHVGTLVEFADSLLGTIPEASDAFDLAVIAVPWSEETGAEHSIVVEEAFRLIRPGGRIVVLLSADQARWPLGPKKVPRALAEQAAGFLTRVGSRAVRVLAEVPGTTYVEGAKPRV